MAALIRKFEEICASNGDDDCFYISEYYGDTTINSSSSNNHKTKAKKSSTRTTESNRNPLPKTSVGFSELNENIKLIANEMYFRHSIGGPKSFTTSTNARFDSCSVPSQEQIRQSCANSVFIVSDQPSPGEAAAVMACVKLQSVFVPISLNGLHRTSDRRLQIILKETKPIAAIVVLTVVAPNPPEGAHITESDDWETKPALSTNEIIDVDSHSTIMKLNSLGVHRIITVNGLDGSVIGGMAGLSVGEVDLPTMQVDYDDRQPMYILYTSGSTSRPKAVVQTYSGLLNRIQWQWRVFPFVQQIRRNVGYNETVELLKQDGILKCKNGERLYDINDIVLRRTSLSFVDAIAEIFGTLLGGAALFCPMWIERIGQEQQWQGVGLSAMLDVARRDKIRVTRMTCLPSQLGQAFRHSENDQCLNGGDYSWTKTLNMVITETSGDVSCLVASSGNRGQSLSRFPLASKYIWNGPSHFKSTGGSNFIDNCVKSLVPCGLPIDGHVIMFKPNMSTDDASSSRVGCLHVSGPGVALGYSNNKYEMIANFSVSQNENKKGSAEVVSNLTFNTMDLTFEDDEGIVYVVGRAPRDIDDVASNDGNLCSLTMGKLNGVMIHSAEIEQAMLTAFMKVRRTHNLHRHHSDDPGISIVAILLKDANDKNKSVVFIDASSIQDILLHPVSCEDAAILEASSVKISSGISFQDLIIESRSEILQNNLSSLVPHHIHLISSLPKNGAAGKIDRSFLARTAITKMVSQSSTWDQSLEDGSESFQEFIVAVYRSTLSLSTSEDRKRPSASFAELGGDSMMAINTCHSILSYFRRKGVQLSNDQMVTPLDIMQLPMDFVIDIIKNGRDNLPPEKKKAKFTASDDIFDLEALPSTTIFKDSATLDTTSLQKKWKVPMLMCVDSSPLVIRRDDVNIVIAGSQRGDLVCVDDISGDVLHRSLVSGKIEGDLSYLQSDCTDTETMIFIPTYSSVDRKHKGTAYALHLKGTSLVPSWEHKCVGEIKNKLTAFIYPGSKLSKRLLCATYDGSLTYLDAANGRVLQVTEDLGGAVHADPILIHGSADTTRNLFALVASCAWKGAVSCVSLAESSWTIDLWTPVYSTPTLSPNSESQVTLCGVDGSVRSIKLEDGVEVWRLDTENRRW